MNLIEKKKTYFDNILNNGQFLKLVFQIRPRNLRKALHKYSIPSLLTRSNFLSSKPTNSFLIRFQPKQFI